MSRIPPIPQLVVRIHEPGRVRRRVLLGLLGVVIAIAGAAATGWHLAQLAGAGADKRVLEGVQAENETLKQRIAVLERGEQVGKVAGADLQQSLKERDEEIAALRADLAFYARLVGGGAKREGLAVHSVHVSPVDKSRAWNVSITLTQNLKRSQIINGRVQLSIEGIAGGQLKSMPWSELADAADAGGWTFSFKYFQQVEGTVMLPEGFTPNRIKVVVDAGGEGGRIEQGFAWAEALASEEANNVQQQQEVGGNAR